MYVLTLNCITNEMELNSDVACAKGGLGGGRNCHAGLIVFTNKGGPSWSMTKFCQQHAQIDCFSCGQAKSNIFCFSCGFGDSGLKSAAVRDGAAAHAEHIAADRLAIAVRGGEVTVSEPDKVSGPGTARKVMPMSAVPLR